MPLWLAGWRFRLPDASAGMPDEFYEGLGVFLYVYVCQCGHMREEYVGVCLGL